MLVLQWVDTVMIKVNEERLLFANMMQISTLTHFCYPAITQRNHHNFDYSDYQNFGKAFGQTQVLTKKEMLDKASWLRPENVNFMLQLNCNINCLAFC